MGDILLRLNLFEHCTGVNAPVDVENDKIHNSLFVCKLLQIFIELNSSKFPLNGGGNEMKDILLRLNYLNTVLESTPL